MRISDWSSDVCSSDLGVRSFGRKPCDAFSGHFGRITDSISEPIVASCRAEAVPVELKQSLLPGFGFRRVIFRQEIDQFAHAAGPVAADHQIFVGRSEERTSELQSLMRHSYAVFCL